MIYSIIEGLCESLQIYKYITYNTNKIEKAHLQFLVLNVLYPCVIYNMLNDKYAFLILWKTFMCPYITIYNMVYMKEIFKSITSNNISIGQIVLCIIKDVYIIIGFLMQCILLSTIPFVGKYIYFIFMCLYYSFISFDYGWSYRNYSMQERIHFFETRYSYFLGFGILNSLIDMIVPYPYNTCLNDALLPVMCKIAMNVKLKNLHKSRRIRFLYTSDLISEKLLTFTWFILIKQGKYKDCYWQDINII